MKVNLVQQMQSYVAEACLGASALRNQGGSGLVRAARKYFKTLDLSAIPSYGRQFNSWLDQHTDELQSEFPHGAKNFGAARKALNLFLRSAAYNKALNCAHRLDRLLPLLEVPLDSYVAEHLKSHEPSLPNKWERLKFLSKNEHREYQAAARKLAKSWQVHRVDLDVFFYREEVGVT
jgi:hypothetical protein